MIEKAIGYWVKGEQLLVMWGTDCLAAASVRLFVFGREKK
jgi:hypothetical protein